MSCERLRYAARDKAKSLLQARVRRLLQELSYDSIPTVLVASELALIQRTGEAYCGEAAIESAKKLYADCDKRDELRASSPTNNSRKSVWALPVLGHISCSGRTARNAPRPIRPSERQLPRA